MTPRPPSAHGSTSRTTGRPRLWSVTATRHSPRTCDTATVTVPRSGPCRTALVTASVVSSAMVLTQASGQPARRAHATTHRRLVGMPSRAAVKLSESTTRLPVCRRSGHRHGSPPTSVHG